jgi:NitT/TauT family transport system permease protein
VSAAPLRDKVGARALGLGSLVFVLAVVEALIRVGVLNRFIMPLPSEILLSFGRVVAEEDVIARFLETATEALVASVLVIVIGVSLGVFLYSHRLLRMACETWVAALAAAPVVLAYPLFLVIFGRSAWTIIMIGLASGIAPTVLKTIEGLSTIRPTLLNVGRSFSLTRSQQFWKIQFPAAVPTIFVGLRIGLIFCLINIVGVEFLINFGGLGHLINDLAERYEQPGTYAVITFVVLVSVLFFMALEKVETWLRPSA